MQQNTYFIYLGSWLFSSFHQAVIVMAIIDVYHFNIKVFSLRVLDMNDFDLWFYPQHCSFRMHDMIIYEMGIENSLKIHKHVFMQSLKFSYVGCLSTKFEHSNISNYIYIYIYIVMVP